MSEQSKPNADAQFLRLFNQNSDQIQSYIGTLLPQTADAEEVFQQTSITLWRKFDEFRPEESFLAWARGIAFNLVRNFRTVESRRPVFLLGDDVLESIARVQPAATDQLSLRREALHACLKKLSKFDRDLVDQCYRAKGALKEVAAQQGWTANALYKRLKTIRRALFLCIDRALLNERGL